MLRVMTVVGTRPELIKLSCVTAELDRYTEHTLVHTGQNYDFELNAIFFDDLGIRKPDYFLNAAGRTAILTIANVLQKIDELLEQVRPDAFLIYGDTNSCLAALSAKRRQIPVFHMEAGNRCFDERVPEEINRRLLDHLSDINLPLTEHGRRNLLAEGIRTDRIVKTGSPMPEVIERQNTRINASKIVSNMKLSDSSYFVLSAHREENVDDPKRLKRLSESVRLIAETFSMPIVFSVHPRTRARIEEHRISFPPQVRALPPLSFSDYMALQRHAFCVVSDSGTVTEEANIVGFPAVTIRESHERPEGTEEGVLILTGLDPGVIVDAIRVVTDQWAVWKGNRRRVEDYSPKSVSQIVVRTILGYTPLTLREVWKRSS